MAIGIRLIGIVILGLPLVTAPVLAAPKQKGAAAQSKSVAGATPQQQKSSGVKSGNAAAPKSDSNTQHKTPIVTAQRTPMTLPKTTLVLGTATPGGGFPLFGDALAAAVNSTDSSFHIETRNTKGSAENVKLLEESKVDIALVAGEPAYEAFAGIGRPVTSAKIITAIYSNPGMFAVRGDSPYPSLQSLIGQPVVWGTRDSGLTLLARYVLDGLGLDRERDFQALYLDRAGDGPAMVLEGRAAALWGGGIGWPGFTAVTQAGGRLIGLSPADVARISKKHIFLKPLTVPAGTYPNQNEVITSVGSWSYVLARPGLDDDIAYRLARAIHRSYNALVQRLTQARETTPQNTVTAAPRLVHIHPGVQKYFREIGVIR
ncbi:MAG TPA: TAXI family TRAP transporter solute-binding subunit [Xanthobacteraceae bacterium]|nr:TAXI family TRAP transporter solute-binding subunit [Xanthobacteraceae bacterium]